MKSPADTLIDLNARLKATGWHIVEILVLGALAVALAAYGQDSLEGARPIFPMIDQNFALWQAGYVGVLVLAGLLWAAALLQKLNLFQNCLAHMKIQRGLEEKHQRREQEREQRKLEAAQSKEDSERAAVSVSFKKTRSTKFDY
jgi:hypothetical protein